MSIEAMKQALEYIEANAETKDEHEIAAGLRQAIAEAEKQDHIRDATKMVEQEPAAWVGYNLDDICEAFDRVIEEHHSRTNPFHDPVNKDAMLALRILRGFIPYMKRYTHPQPKREPLTNESPLLVFAKECVLGAYREDELADAAFKAIEAAHGIKENA